MAIETSMNGVVNYVVARADFVDQVTGLGEEAVADIRKAADGLDAARKEAADLVNKLSTTPFAVSATPETKGRQQRYLERIEQLSKDVQAFEDDPQLVRLLLNERSQMYLLLANTYGGAIKNCVPFLTQEVEELRVLLRRSILDTESRQKKAHVLDAAIQLSKLAFRAAAKLAAV